jgi:TRAP-type mannitol/chloroaromatic compound transport system permease small subunit
VNKWIRFFELIDRTSERIGTVLSFSLIVLMVIQVLEATLRYVFDSPTSWAWAVNGQIFSGAAMLAGVYALLHDTHVRLDILHRNFSARTKKIIDLASFPLVITALCFVLWQGIDMVWWSFTMGERAHSYFAPIMWPVKSCLPIAALLMIFQAISRYGKILLDIKPTETKDLQEVE